MTNANGLLLGAALGAALLVVPAVAEELQDCPTCPVMVTLEDGAAVGKFPVTREEYTVFAEATDLDAKGCLHRTVPRWNDVADGDWQNVGFEQGPKHPVVCVNWLEATRYVDWLSETTGHSYRLPTLEELQAVAAPQGQTFPWGEGYADICQHANSADASFKQAFPGDEREMNPCDDGYANTSPVDAFPPNAYGLHDMAGNVWEWTNSCLKGDCSNAIFRGASWTDMWPNTFEVTHSFGDRIVLRNSAIGFRVYRDSE